MMGSKLRTVAIIPARAMSERLPGKPLKHVGGTSLLERTWTHAREIPGISRVAVATDDPMIASSAAEFGAEVIMTGSYNAAGCDRVNEALETLRREGHEFDLVVAVPVSLPFLSAQVVVELVETLEAEPEYQMATAACPILDIDEFMTTSVVKVTFNHSRRALFFSRAPIPYTREGYSVVSASNPFGYRNIPVFAYRADALPHLGSVTPDTLESAEELEQLRAISLGVPVKVVEVSRELAAPLIEVNRPDDLQSAEAYLKESADGRGEAT